MPGTYSKLVTVISGQTITASERNNEFDNVINNMTPDGVDDASANTAAMQATTDPSGASLATDLRGELKRLRFQLLKLGSASGNWYDALPFLAGITPATPGATATDLNNRLAQIVKHLQILNVASGNWYDTMSFLAGITPAAAGATGTDLTNRLAQIASQIKNLGGLTNWYDSVTAALLKAGGTMAGAIAMGTNKITGVGNGTAAQDVAAFGQIPVFTAWAAWTPTFGGLGTVVNIAFYWRRVGESMEIQGFATTGTVSGANAQFTLPNSLATPSTIVTASGSDYSIVGNFGVAQNSANYCPVLSAPAETHLFFGSAGAGTKATNIALGTGAFSTGVNFSLHASVPINGWGVYS